MVPLIGEQGGLNEASKETLHKEFQKYHYKLTYITNNLLFLSMFLDYLFPLLESGLLTHPENI